MIHARGALSQGRACQGSQTVRPHAGTFLRILVTQLWLLQNASVYQGSVTVQELRKEADVKQKMHLLHVGLLVLWCPHHLLATQCFQRRSCHPLS